METALRRYTPSRNFNDAQHENGVHGLNGGTACSMEYFGGVRIRVPVLALFIAVMAIQQSPGRLCSQSSRLTVLVCGYLRCKPCTKINV
jgi:hypothetical protein